MAVEVIPALGDNYAYLVVCPRTGRAAAVDPAQPDAVLARVAELGVELAAIWCTHHHWDHVGGNEELLRRSPALEVVAHRADGDRVPGATRLVDDGDEVTLGQLAAGVVHVPGHTRGAIAYFLADQLEGDAGPAVLTGDTLFGAGCGRLFEGDAATMHASLARLAALPRETVVYCGHEYTAKNLSFAATVEPENHRRERRAAAVAELRAHGRPSVPSTIAEELATNPFLRGASAAIRANLEQRFAGERFDSALAVFTRLRQLRDRF